jgi:large subunit ribosomal protein L6
MSRIGKQNIIIPEGVTVNKDGSFVRVKGPKGELAREFKTNIVDINIDGNSITLDKKGVDTFANALWGTYASHVKNMIEGVSSGFSKKLILEGVGFKSDVSNNKLNLALGFSHPVNIDIPIGLTVTAEKNVITFTGIDKEIVGAFASKIRSMKKPEPYKGKGFRYDNEVIRRKQGKKSA